MIHISQKIKSSSVVILLATLFFSCTNDIKKVRDYLADKNLPIGVSEKIYTVYMDSGRVTTKLISPLFLDFSNREEHPYTEFPQGIKIIKIDKETDSTTISGNYAINYTKTNISEIKGNVIVHNHASNYILRTEQLYWDQNEHYFISEKKFIFMTPHDTLYGTAFESNEDLSRWSATDNRGTFNVVE